VAQECYQSLTSEDELPEAISSCFGRYDGPEKQSIADEGTVSTAYDPTSEYRMRLKLSSRRYSEALTSGKLTPQDEGIVLHGIMERARTIEDIHSAIESLVIDRVLSADSAQILTAQLEQVVSNPAVADWFSDQWQQIHIENSIIAPGIGTRRPDRVMINGNKAIVVDYKFGERNNSYRKQIALYCSLLKKMGYSETKGYLWYVREGDIEEVI
jgi:ATP-dependent exoDNAse (exonuclease V) beta subunit